MDLFNAPFLAGNLPAADFSERWQSGYNLLAENGQNYGPEMSWSESNGMSRSPEPLWLGWNHWREFSHLSKISSWQEQGGKRTNKWEYMWQNTKNGKNGIV